MDLLHVDDEEEFADLAAAMLEREADEFTVHTATSAAEGLELLSPEIDCVVSDYDMPDASGIEFLEAVREGYPDLPFILFTGKGSEEIASEAISAGVTDYLQKGTRSEQYTILANRVENAVEQNRAARSAERKDRWLTEITENSNDVLWMFTADWSECLVISSAYDDIWGLPRTELDDDPTAFLEGIHPDDRERAVTAMERVSDGEFTDLEFRVNPDEGFEQWVWVQGQPIYDDEGEVIRVTGFARDITARKRREEVLKQLHEVVTERSVYETPVAICERAVEAAQRLLEFDMCVVNLEADGELHVTATSDELPPDGRRSMSVDEGLVGKTYRTGESFLVDDVGDCEAADPQGPYRSALSIPVGDHGVFQTVSETTGAFDGTDRELAEILVAHTARALDLLAREQNLAEYETIIGALGDPVYVVDADGNYTFVNEPFAELTGYTTEELLGMHAADVLDESSYERAVDCVRRFLSSDSNVDQETDEVTIVTADGERIACEDTLALLPLDDGEYQGAAGVVRDVSERKARTQELRRQNERLEEFASIVSHDLRTPLNLAYGRLELAAEECDSDHLDGATAALDRMDELIENLLSLARKGESVGDVAPVVLHDAATRCWQLVSTDDASLEIITSKTVLAAESRLVELLENLFGNAVEHGSPTAITVGDLDDGFYVADDGPGIPEAEREDVFDAAYSSVADNTGFGLAIVASIADAHGWTVSITESEAGGARFEFTGIERPP